MAQQVWIVQHDASPHNTVLGVFANQDDALAFADEVKDRWKDGVITAPFEIGYRYDSLGYGFAPNR